MLVAMLASPAAAQQSLSGATSQAVQPDDTASACGTQPITIARMIWPSAELMAAIHQRILTSRFGCHVTLVPGDMAATVSAMATTGQPAVAPEIWANRVADVWNQAVKSQKVRPTGSTYQTTSFEGWYIPDYLAEAHPELKDVAAIKAHPDWFAAAPGQKPQFLTCPVDWACSVINANLLRADGLTPLFDVVTPKNRFEMDSLIAEAVSRKQPLLFYYWQPDAVLNQFRFDPVGLGPYNADAYACLGRRDCAEPRPSAFPPEPVLSALSEWVYTGLPEITAYFQRATMPIEVMNELLHKLDAPGATVDTVADGFITDHADLWQRWLGTPAQSGN